MSSATEYRFSGAPLSSGEIRLTLEGGMLGPPSGHQRVTGRVRLAENPPTVVDMHDAVIGGARLAPNGTLAELARDLFAAVSGVFHVGDHADALAIAFASFVGGGRDARAQLASIDPAGGLATFAFEGTAHVEHGGPAEIPVRGDITIDREVRRVEGRMSGRVEGTQLVVSLSAVR